MQKKTDEHQFTGMQRDMSISKQKAEFLWDAHNIRLTSRHGETLLSMTNERGTERCKDSDYDDISFRGIVLGYCVLGEYLTVFTTDTTAQTNADYIYRIDKLDHSFECRILYNGNLGFDINHPIECLGVYENVDIQKVYWTDGINQPRFINITKRVPTDGYTDTSFDFIPTLSLKDTIHVKKVADSSGLFPAGVIQYAVTYYNKYGQESNVSVVSPLIATSYTSRAGSPEDTIGNAFKVTIKNPDDQFEFLRLYSIFRSSKDTTPVCKRVADVRLGYGGRSADKLYVSGNVHSTRYARIKSDTLQVKTVHNGTFITDLSAYEVAESANIDGVILDANRYYHFTKEDFPYLIVKVNTYTTDGLNLKPTCFTWDTCTDIYISKDNVAGPGTADNPLLYCSGGEHPKMKAADDMHYNYNEFISNNEVTITDNNTIGEDIDYNELLFVGGEVITAGTITQKDGTMFLGDIKTKRPQITGDYAVIRRNSLPEISTELAKDYPNVINIIRKGVTTLESSYRTCCFPVTMNSSSYQWGNTLDAHIYNNANHTDMDESTNVAGFKAGEHYRLGLQFQYKTGKWSQPVFIEDVTNSNNPSLNITDLCVQNIPTFRAVLNSQAGNYLLSQEYKRVRPVVCFPTESDQLILCQGLLNPTVHSIAGRLNHAPDVQSSWYFRPVPAGTEWNDQTGVETMFEGGIPQYLHGHSLYSGKISEKLQQGSTYRELIPTRHDEIQGVPVQFSAQDYTTELESDYSSIQLPAVNINVKPTVMDAPWLKDPVYDANDLTNVFVVDWNYLTFHSPEFEFNDSFHNIDTTTMECKITGRHLVTSNQGDIHITTITAPISSDAPGFYHRIIFSGRTAYRINAGLFYKDATVMYKKDKDNLPLSYKAEDNGPEDQEDNADSNIYSFLTYPWHRTGSLNNDCVRPEGYGNRTAMLNQKKMINLMYFGTKSNELNNRLYIQKTVDGTTVQSNVDIRIFNSDQVSLTKVNDKNYFGNIDQVLSPFFKYNVGYSTGTNFSGSSIQYLPTDGLTDKDSNKKGLFVPNDPIYMKYKSTAHAVVYTNTTIDLALGNTQSKLFDNKAWPYLYCAEMYRGELPTDFGGTSAMAIHNNLWYPAGPAVEIRQNVDTVIQYMYGDTYYQRYDCLKTYPFTDEDTNSIIEIGSFMVETRINMDGRYDKNRGNINNFMLNPTNFNLINPVYSQMDNFFNYRILDEDYYDLSQYPTMVTWTGYKNNAAEVDNWTNITLANTLEMDGTKGKVNAVRVNSDQLYCFQDDAVGQILFNSRVQISPSDGVPIEISNNYKVDGNRYISTSIGCKNKWSIIEGIDGLYFIDDNTKALYLLGGQAQLKAISTPLNMSYWFTNQDTATLWVQHYWDGNREYSQQGIRCFYDNANSDLYVCTPEQTLCYSEKLGQFISFFDYHNVIGMFNIDSDYYALSYPDENTPSDISLWGMFKGTYNMFFDRIYQSDFTFISNENPLNDKIFTNIELRGDFRWWGKNQIEDDFNSSDHVVQHNRMFDTLKVWNEYQDTDTVDLRYIRDTVSNMKKKFRIWRMDIPRDKDNIRQRIRNTWTKVMFTMNLPIELKDLVGKVSKEFAVFDHGEQKDLDFMGKNTQFIYDSANDCVVETRLDGTHTEVARYYLTGSIIERRPTGSNISQVYAYRKLYDMEIHDVGVVYFV